MSYEFATAIMSVVQSLRTLGGGLLEHQLVCPGSRCSDNVQGTTSYRTIFGFVVLLTFVQITAAETSSSSAVHQDLLSGRPVAFQPGASRTARTIPAIWLLEAVRKGAELNVTNAFIRGPLRVRQRNYKIALPFENDVSLIGCDFEDQADFSYSIFKQTLVLTGSIFHGGASFEGASVQRKAILDRVEFDGGEANFRDAHFNNFLSMQGARFHVKTFFNGAQFDKGADFANGMFADQAIFENIQSGSDLVFQQTHFARLLRLTTSKIAGSLFIVAAEFVGPVQFPGVQIAQNAKFGGAVFKNLFNFTDGQVGSFIDLTGTQFESDSKPVNFERVRIGGRAILDHARFAGTTNFPSVRIGSDASFDGTTFQGPVWFEGAEFVGRAAFHATEFQRLAHFGRVEFHEESLFDGVVFTKEADFTASHFHGLANFNSLKSEKTQKTTFRAGVSFDQARFEEGARFEDCIFHKYVSFYQSSFTALYLSPNGRVDQQDQLPGIVDLQGCTYDRIQVDWRSLLQRPDGSPRPRKYDRQTYVQLAKFLRATGDEQTADEVYLEQRRLERKQLFHTSTVSWLADCFSLITTRYGVARGRLLEFSLVLLFLGMLIFSRPGAVSRNNGNGKDQEKNAAADSHASKLSHWDALAVSVHQFLPLDVPFGSQWTPGMNPIQLEVRLWSGKKRLLKITPCTCASVLRIGGWILVPIIVAIVTGLLSGQQRSIS